MGSFNISCFVSRQVIRTGDKVVIFPVTRTPSLFVCNGKYALAEYIDCGYCRCSVGITYHYSQDIVVMHESSFDHLVQYANNLVTGDGRTHSMKDYFIEYTFKSFLDLKRIVTSRESFQRLFFFINPLVNESGILSHQRELVSDRIYTILDEDDKSLEEKQKEVYNLAKPIIKQAYALVAMNYLGIRLDYSSYARQDDKNTAGDAYLKLVQEVNSKLDKER